MKYTDIVTANKELQSSLVGPEYKITVLSNIMVHQLGDVLEYQLKTQDINATVGFGDYNNIVQNSSQIEKISCAILFWETINLVDGLEYKIDTLAQVDIDALYQKTISEIDFVFNNLKKIPLVICNLFTACAFNYQSIEISKLELLAEKLNYYLQQKQPQNLKSINIDKIIFSLSINQSFDYRFYRSSKSLYKTDFFKTYSSYIQSYILSANGKTKKALIFDCDNTLWKGILAEDGYNGIKIYKDIQYLAKSLTQKGVIIGLCSKNNQEEVDFVFANHSDIKLNSDDIIIKKINWKNKAENLNAIAIELNIGLDSLVFIDDSAFEINLIKECLPQISCFQVPKKAYQYANMLREISRLFYHTSITKEDLNKSKIYQQQINRNKSQHSFNNIDDYLQSLELKMFVSFNEGKYTARLSQLTQKTNQFNLTTKRYSESEIENFINNEDFLVISVDIKDKFGDNGLTGLMIVKIENSCAHIDTFLLSCRIIGRNIEYSLFDCLIQQLKLFDIDTLYAQYIKTIKNTQVCKLYKKLGMIQKDEQHFQLKLKDYRMNKLQYIKVINNNE